MYEDLVKRLNAYSAEHQKHGGITAEAADAIEELQQIAMHYKGCSDDWYREACEYKTALEETEAQLAAARKVLAWLAEPPEEGEEDG